MLLKALTVIIAFGVIFLLGTFVYAWYFKTMFVIDTHDESELPRHFRVLEDMRIAGGGQFSEAGFETILKNLNTTQLTVIDLRQESHGFLNGHAVSWYGLHNADNAKKTIAQVEADQIRLLNEVKQQTQININQIVQKSREGRIEKLKPITMQVLRVFSESEWLKERGQHYFRFYVQDFHAPASSEVDRFIELFKSQPKNQWLYFHCRAGIGRTSVFMLLYDILLHAKIKSLDKIMDEHIAAGGRDLRQLLPRSHYKYQWHKKRLEFLINFYQYAHDNKDDFNTTFSEWRYFPR